MKLSVVIPAYNEEGSIEKTTLAFDAELNKQKIDHEILVVNDGSKDKTESILKKLSSKNKNLRYVNNPTPGGFGLAVRCGLDNFNGDYAAIVMADMSDDPKNLVKMYKKAVRENLDAVFGSRFHPESKVSDYPKFKLFINRIVNFFIKILFFINYNDTTNAFKLYKKETIKGISPLISKHFNLTVEMPLKTIIRGYSYAVIPTNWTNRTTGESKLRLKEMGSRYLFIILYSLVEKFFSRGDYRKKK